MKRTGLLLINLGTPETPDVPDVRRYLREFLSDPRVIDIAPIRRWLFLNLVILPFRPRASAKAYRKIWEERGSPLLFHGHDLVEATGKLLGDDFDVRLAMRYQRPSIGEALGRFREHGVERIVVFPLFPQYSSAAWGSAVEKVFAEAGRLWNLPSIQVVPAFYDHPAFIQAFATVASPVLEAAGAERIIMSFHGLPERHLAKSDDTHGAHCLAAPGCCDRIDQRNQYCYRTHCFATARALATALGLGETEYEVTFQSRLGRSPWTRPYTDVRIKELAAEGVKRVAVIVPSFVADCLETIEEIGIRAKEDFESRGGECLTLVPSLNSADCWARAVIEIIQGLTHSVPRDRSELVTA